MRLVAGLQSGRNAGGRSANWHHASEGQRMKLVGVNLLEKLLMTTAAPAKRYMSMIIGGLCHKSGWPVRPSEASYWLTDRKWWHKPLMIIHMYCLTGAAVVIGSCSRIQLRSHHSHHRWPEPVCLARFCPTSLQFHFNFKKSTSAIPALEVTWGLTSLQMEVQDEDSCHYYVLWGWGGGLSVKLQFLCHAPRNQGLNLIQKNEL